MTRLRKKRKPTGNWWGKSERKKVLGGANLRLEYNITIDLKEVGWGSMDSINLTQDRDKCWGSFERCFQP